MRVRIYTEQAWNSYPHPICGCFGEYRSPLWITPEDVKNVLEMSRLPGSESIEFIVASDETIRRAKEDRSVAERLPERRIPIFTM